MAAITDPFVTVPKTKLLFLCSRNQWRSPSAADTSLLTRLQTVLAPHLPDLWVISPEHLPTRSHLST